MKQEEMLDKIRKSADSVPTPAGLEPEQMMMRLEEYKGRNGRLGKNNRKRIWGYGGLAAAVLAVCVLARFPSRTMAPAGEAPANEEMLPPKETQKGHQTSAAGDIAVEPEDEEALFLASSYEELYDQIQEYNRILNTDIIVDAGVDTVFPGTGVADGGIIREEEMSHDVPKLESVTSETGASAESGFSGTNIQVQGVDEGDLVKTDGIFIYVSAGDRGKIQIIRAKGEKMELAGTIPDTSTVSGAKTIEEFYINGAYVSVIRMDYSAGTTILETYDLNNPKEPKLLGTVSQDGYYNTSRRNGDYIYLFTDYYAEVEAKKEEIERYVPKVGGSVIPLNCIYLPDQPGGYSYLVASSVDMKKPDQAVQSKAVYTEGDHFYVSRNNIYIGNTSYDYKADQSDYTELMKFSYEDGTINFRAHGNVDGYLNDQFSMDEYEGNLRLVTTLSHQSGSQTNSLIVLDSKLKKMGEIEDLAPGEQIYSARFMGDTAYFVTFRNMDPLFSADLSDPENPKILGELKITGFSEYLHPYTDGLLLGIGREINPDTGNFKGLKLSMFDINQPSDVTEKDKTVESAFEYTPAWDNHKAVVISAEKNLIGFAAEEYDRDRRKWFNRYVVYSYEEGQGFTRRLTYELEKERDQSQTRGIFIGEWFYVVEEDKVTVFDMAHFKEFGDLKF
ncbi:beta-propeller domain-containing protein [Clostridium sp. MCC353]|uniref:beta-propeller domain-containing protein n=1 Tax=Clostridium sp. MCC353 TaxID=2592646 RepID=UPI001C00F4C3|nr:beta-propeller domain-containing protein [Clostridium sp. MCC353]